MRKYILSLFVGFVGFISFCNANGIVNYSGSDSVWLRPDFNGCNGYISCTFNNSSNLYFSLSIGYYNLGGFTASNSIGNQLVSAGKPYIYHINQSNCSNLSVIGLRDIDGYSYDCYIYGDFISSSGGGTCPECPTCPEVNTGEILSGYVLESEIDTNYCVGNGLCPNECGSGTDLSGDLQFSNLYINNILHPGQENIFIDIPDYITWDYSIDTGNFNLYVGSGYDMDYMNSIIKINSYRPDSQDFTNIFVSGLTLVFPYIAILLLIVFIWKLLKRIFK